MARSQVSGANARRLRDMNIIIRALPMSRARWSTIIGFCHTSTVIFPSRPGLAFATNVRSNASQFDLTRLRFAYLYGSRKRRVHKGYMERLMPARDARAISKRTVDALPADGKDALYWDRHLPGFGVRVAASGRKTYIVQSRGPNGSVRVTIGPHGTITPDQARKQAAATIDRIKRGEDPVPRHPGPNLLWPIWPRGSCALM